MVYDIQTGIYRDKIDYIFPYAKTMIEDLKNGDYESAIESLISNRSVEAELCVEFLLKYILYALYISEIVGYEITAADDVMATGFNWCPPIAMTKLFSKVTNLKTLIEERIDKKVLDCIEVDRLLEKIQYSKYDYRIYFKSIK